MSSQKPRRQPSTSWLWIAILAVLLVVIVVWFLDPLGYAGHTQPGAPVAASSDFVTAPEGPAVPVTLPTVTVTSATATPTASDDASPGQ
jgi:hypothetical protein